MIHLDKLKEYLDSDVFKEYVDKSVRFDRVRQSQLDRLHVSGKFVEFTIKVIEKYESDGYRDRWYNRGIEPPEDLYWYLFDYAIKYGRECSDDEWETIGNCFTSGLYYCDGFYFNWMDGQGSVIKVTREISSGK